MSLATLNCSKGPKAIRPCDINMNVYNISMKFHAIDVPTNSQVNYMNYCFVFWLVELRILICCSKSSTVDCAFRLCSFERLTLLYVTLCC
jgi:hypothetical protein